MQAHFFSWLLLFSVSLLTSCATNKTKGTSAQEELINGNWYLSSLRGEKQLGEERVMLVFDAKTKTYNCQSFCNTLSGTYSTKQGMLRMEQHAMSYKACPKADLEKILRHTFSQIDSFRLINSVLYCYAHKKVLATFSSHI